MIPAQRNSGLVATTAAGYDVERNRAAALPVARAYLGSDA